MRGGGHASTTPVSPALAEGDSAGIPARATARLPLLRSRPANPLKTPQPGG